MSFIHRLRAIAKKAFTPVTILLIPHSKREPLNLKIPFIGICASLITCGFGVVFIFSIAVETLEYYRMKHKLNYYTAQFMELKQTMTSLKKTDAEFKRLFSLGSKEKVLENVGTSDSGSIDMDNLKQQISITMETVEEIKYYLHKARDIYLATPKGFPVDGEISSYFGKRANPRTGSPEFHSGFDIAADMGKPVHATAEGIVSFSGWSGGSGNLVVLEHGHGYSTCYAHNSENLVRVGQKVKKNEVISRVGSTGRSTGPHVHYEIWKQGKPVDPSNFVKGRV